MRNKCFLPSGRKKKIVIFDFDGTLIDAYRAVEESVNFTMRAIGYPTVSARKIKRSVGWGERHLLRQFIRPQDFSRGLKIYRRHHPGALRRGSKMLPGALGLLQYLKKDGYRIAVATNRANRFTRLLARTLKIQQYFDYIRCGDQVPRPKPFPDMLQEILAKYRLKPRQAVFVGDMTVDLKAGKRAGIFTVGIATGSCTRKELLAANPGVIIRRIGAVKKILARLEAKGKIV